jgi:MFS family permease
MPQQRFTKKQLAWRPNTLKPRRSTRVMFASVLLTLQALALVFAGLAMFGLRGRFHGGVPALVLCLILAVVMILACAFVKKPWGIGLGWVLQVLTLALGILEPAMYLVGVAFLAMWAYCIIKGGQMDRIDDQREREQRQWEASHPDQA